jgi:hypothetical protein
VKRRDQEALLAEYHAAQDAYLHYDGFRWQSGSFLVGGVFIFWGLLIQTTDVQDRALIAGSVLVTLVMGLWLLFAHHYRQVYLWKLDRINEIEDRLGLEQHRRFSPARRGFPYETFGFKGHHLDILVFIALSAGGPWLAMARNGFAGWIVAPVAVLVTLIVVVVMWNESRARHSRELFIVKFRGRFSSRQRRL